MERLRRFLAGFVVLLMLCGAVQAADRSAVFDAMSQRMKQVHGASLNQQQNDALKRFKDAYITYEEDRFPTNSPEAVAKVRDNLILLLNSLDGPGVDKLMGVADGYLRQKSAKYPYDLDFDHFVDAVVFITVASDDVIANLRSRLAWKDENGGEPVPTSLAFAGIATLTWSRLPPGKERSLDAQTDWSDVRTLYEERRRLHDFDVEKKTQFLSDSTLLRLPSDEERESTLTPMFAKRLHRIYGYLRTPGVENGLREADFNDLIGDVARIQYLTLISDRSGRLAGLVYLEQLEKALAPYDPPAQVAIPSSEQKLKRRDDLNKEIAQHLNVIERDHGFRTQRLVPNGILGPTQFFEMLRAGYLPDDIGAGKEHGSLTHRLQFYMLMRHFEAKLAWHFLPAEVYSRIGMLDLFREEHNNESLFFLERAKSIWAHVLDQQSGRGDEGVDLSRPDHLIPILEKGGKFPKLLARLKEMNTLQLLRGEQLRADFVSSSGSPLLFEMSPEDKARIDEMIQRSANVAAADELFLLEHYDRLRKVHGFRSVDDLPLLIESGATYLAGPDAESLAKARERFRQRLPDGPVTAANAGEVRLPRDTDRQARALPDRSRRQARQLDRGSVAEFFVANSAAPSSVDNNDDDDIDDKVRPVSGSREVVTPPSGHTLAAAIDERNPATLLSVPEGEQERERPDAARDLPDTPNDDRGKQPVTDNL